MSLFHLTLKEALHGLKKKEFTAEELTKAFLKRIGSFNKDLNAFLSIYEKEAEERAQSSDTSSDGALLSGIPFAVKDNMLRFGDIATAGSKILGNYKSSYTATAVKRLEDSGAIVLGRTNLDEFAMGSSTENSAFGTTKNPWDISRVPGGSSGGSAATVAADLAMFALGSDTGGSIRQPASFCGCVGFKPTYGAVSRHGLIAMASSLDQIGPLTKTVEDAAIVMDVISGYDPMDATTTERTISSCKDAVAKASVRDLKIGLPKEFFTKELDPSIAELIRAKVGMLEEMGARIEEVSIPLSSFSLPIYYIIMPSEVSANLARFDGMRYGYSDRSGGALESVYVNSRTKGFGDEARRRIIIGTYTLSSGYYDAFYGRAEKVRRLLTDEFKDAFSKVDVLITPTSPTTAFRFGEKVDDPVTMYLSDIFTVSANVAGIPALSIPAGLVGGLPVGLQIMGKQFDDARVLSVGHLLEKVVQFERLNFNT